MLSYILSVRPGPKRLIVLTTNKQSKQCLSSVAGPENKQTNKQQYGLNINQTFSDTSIKEIRHR